MLNLASSPPRRLFHHQGYVSVPEAMTQTSILLRPMALLVIPNPNTQYILISHAHCHYYYQYMLMITAYLKPLVWSHISSTIMSFPLWDPGDQEITFVG